MLQSSSLKRPMFGQLVAVSSALLAVVATGCNENGAALTTTRSDSSSAPVRTSNAPTEKSSLTSQSVDAPTRKPLLIVLGGYGSAFDIYTVSSGARESLPVQFSNYRLEYLDVMPLGRVPGRAVAVANERYGSGYSIQLLNFSTGSNYTLYSAKGKRLANAMPSPDGQWVAFSEEAIGNSVPQGRVKLLHIETEKTVEIPALKDQRGLVLDGLDDSHPRFTPDGRTLTFERRTKNASTVVSVAVPEAFQSGPAAEATADAEIMLNADVSQSISHFQVSPDGKMQLFARKSGRFSELVVRDLDGNETVITAPNESGFEPSWSPSGNRIVFWTESRDVQAIKVYTLGKGSIPRVLAKFVAPVTMGKTEHNRGYHNVCPAWSFDGTEVYYAANVGNWDEIFKVSTTDSRITRLTDSNIPPPYVCPRVMANYEETR